MIETIYRTESDDRGKPDINIRLPKNIKQIGQSDGVSSCQIYIEENVISFIKQPPREENQIKYGVFLGDIKRGNDYTYVFINGIIEVEEVIESTIIFGEEVWTSIYDNIKRYYKEGMVVGWYGSFESCDVMDMQHIRKIHLDHFAGNHKVFLGVDRQEDEEAFYIYERNGLMKQSCYHVYFEKSEAFEDYLFSTGRQERVVQMKESKPERGKYGIALNNTIGKKDEAIKQVAKWNLSKVASWGTIIALAGVIAAMGLNGDLDALGDNIKGLADNVLDSDDNEPELDNIIPINGSPTATKSGDEFESPSEETSSQETPSEEQSSDGGGTEETSGNDDEAASVSGEVETSTDKSDEEQSSQSADEENQSENNGENNSEEETTEYSEETGLSGGNIEYKTYVVKKGDTLYSIAMNTYGDADKVQEIVELNDLEDENYVMEGQKIFLP